MLRSADGGKNYYVLFHADRDDRHQEQRIREVWFRLDRYDRDDDTHGRRFYFLRHICMLRYQTRGCKVEMMREMGRCQGQADVNRGGRRSQRWAVYSDLVDIVLLPLNESRSS